MEKETISISRMVRLTDMCESLFGLVNGDMIPICAVKMNGVRVYVGYRYNQYPQALKRREGLC